MHSSSGLIALAAFLCSAQAATFGFNYGAQRPDDSAREKSDFATEFVAAKKLAGTNAKFTSARLYTMIQHGTSDEVIQAIPAAIESKTHLLLGLWASGDAANFENEINVLKKAIKEYPELGDLVDGISVGSEDLYRISEIGLKAPDAAPGVGPKVVSSYIKKVREAIKGTSLSGSPVGHVDTWTAWANSSNADVASNSDFIGVDLYPYFQDTMDNDISDAVSLFDEALEETRQYTGDTPMWITETGWPVEGKTKNLAEANTENAETFWNEIACRYLEDDDVNVWWYKLVDDGADPAFGVVDDANSKPRYDLSCKNADTSSKTKSSSSTKKSGSSKTATGSSYASQTGDLDSPEVTKSNSADASYTATKSASKYPYASGYPTGTAPIATGTGSGSAGNGTTTYAAPSAPATPETPAPGAGGEGAGAGEGEAPAAGSDDDVATGAAFANSVSIVTLVGAAAAALLL